MPELQELVFGQPLRAGLAEPRTQAFAVAVVMRRCLRDRGQDGVFLKVRLPRHGQAPGPIARVSMPGLAIFANCYGSRFCSASYRNRPELGHTRGPRRA